MKLLLSSLLLPFLCGHLSLCVSPDMIIVKQTSYASVLEGETVNITCCWMETTGLKRVIWLKNQTYIKNETNITSKEPKQAKNCSTLIFPNITRKDSGRYICRVTVEMPFYKEVDGNGTIITVTARENKDDKDHHKADDGFSSTIVVKQTPDVSVLEGETLNITCCWMEKTGRLRVDWLKNQTVIKTQLRAKNQPQGSVNKQADDCSALIFPSITRKDSGRYICRVTTEIPFLNRAEGIGTVITVIAREKKDDNTDYHKDDVSVNEFQIEMLAFVLRSLPIIALIIAFFWLYYEGTKAQRNPSAATGIKPTPLQNREEDQEEEERDERVTEAAIE